MLGMFDTLNEARERVTIAKPEIKACSAYFHHFADSVIAFF